MTREEAIRLLDLNREYLKNTNNIGLKDDIEALEIAIKALEQEPCDDAISTKEVMKILTMLMSEAGKDGKLILSDAKEMIMELPSVQPKQEPKTGHWTKDECGNIICSECKRFRRDCRYGHTNYCNHCGARMFEPQESGLTDEMKEHYKKLAEHYNGGTHEFI